MQVSLSDKHVTVPSVTDANAGIYIVLECAGEEGRHRWASMGYVLDLMACSCCSAGHHKLPMAKLS